MRPNSLAGTFPIPQVIADPQSPANYSNLVRQQKECGNQRDRDGQRVASEEVQGHGRPAGASGYQRPTN
jgi:hypothetical protein